MENQVAEVAISFDKPYPYEEVRKMLPSNVNLVWLYVYSKRLMKKRVLLVRCLMVFN